MAPSRKFRPAGAPAERRSNQPGPRRQQRHREQPPRAQLRAEWARSGLPADIKEHFLDALAASGRFAAAAAAVDVGRTLLLVERNRDPDFAARWDSSVSEFEALDARLKAGVLGVGERQEGFGAEPAGHNRYIDGLIKWILANAREETGPPHGSARRAGARPGGRCGTGGAGARAPGDLAASAAPLDPAFELERIETLFRDVASRVVEAERRSGGAGSRPAG